MKAQLKYPILVFDPTDDMIWGYGNERDFHTTTTQLLQQHNGKGSVVVDSTGTKYTIRRTYQTGWRGIYGWTGGSTGRIAIEDEYEDYTEKISPDELRRMMMERLLKHTSEEWFIETWVDKDTLCEEFAELRTIEELIATHATVRKFNLWERIQDYFFRLFFVMLACMFLRILWLLLKKAWIWITG